MERCGRALKVYRAGVRMWPTDGEGDAEFADGEEGHEKVLLDSRTICDGEGTRGTLDEATGAACGTLHVFQLSAIIHSC